MKWILVALALLNATGCSANGAKPDTVYENSSIETTGTATNVQDKAMIDVNVKIGNENFSAKLYDNKTTRQLVEQLPATYNMSELHGNEKYYYMQSSLPVDSETPDTINKGEIMLYGSDCLVVFYDTFPNSYSYTRLGYIEEVSDLENAVGKGSVDVTFELK